MSIFYIIETRNILRNFLHLKKNMESKFLKRDRVQHKPEIQSRLKAYYEKFPLKLGEDREDIAIGKNISPYIGLGLREKLENPIVFQGLDTVSGDPSSKILRGYTSGYWRQERQRIAKCQFFLSFLFLCFQNHYCL